MGMKGLFYVTYKYIAICMNGTAGLPPHPLRASSAYDHTFLTVLSPWDSILDSDVQENKAKLVLLTCKWSLHSYHLSVA